MRNYIKALGVGILLGILPMMVSAKGLGVAEGAALNYLSLADFTLVDSIPKGKTQDDKNKDSKKKPGADKEKDPKTVEIDKDRPNIKEVPKARPKLRPGVVTDRVKIKRPPIKVKPGRVMRSIGL